MPKTETEIVKITYKHTGSETPCWSLKLPLFTKDSSRITACFTSETFIAEGGYGRVFQATDILGYNITYKGHDIAIKMIPKTKSALDRIREEAFFNFRYGLSYTKEIEQDSSHYYLPMYKIEGVSLYDYLREIYHNRKPKLTTKTALALLKNILTEAASLEKLEIIHGDIKLENLMIDPKTLQIKFVDFGCAQPSPPLLELGLITRYPGTPGYVREDSIIWSPEGKSTGYIKGTFSEHFAIGITFLSILDLTKDEPDPRVIKLIKSMQTESISSIVGATTYLCRLSSIISPKEAPDALPPIPTSPLDIKISYSPRLWEKPSPLAALQDKETPPDAPRP